jgi:integrase
MNIKQVSADQFFLDVRIKKNGKQYRHRETFSGCLKKAERRYWILRNELLDTAEKASSLTATVYKANTFADLIEFYLERKKTFLSQFEKIEYIFENLRKDLGEVSVFDLADKFDKYLRLIRHDNSRRFGRPLSDSTYNRYIGYAKSICNFAVKYDLIERSPLNRFSKIKEVGRDRILSEEERARLLNVLGSDAPHLKPAVEFALMIPIRKSELVSLKKESLDLINNVIRLRNGTTKNNRGTFIPIPPGMVQYFRSIPKESEYLFYRQKGDRYFSIGDFKKAWQRVKRLAGIEDFHFHDLRHISATEMIDAGTPERVVREIANWKTDMLNRYYHLSSKKILESVQYAPPRVHSGYTFQNLAL